MCPGVIILFCLATSEVFRHLVTVHTGVLCLRIADDIYICAPADLARSFLEDVRSLGPTVGYELNYKTTLYSPDGSIDFTSWGEAVHDDDGRIFDLTTEGFECLGSFIGTDSFVGERTASRFGS